jgi:phage antirepressor YoqD-like protein
MIIDDYHPTANRFESLTKESTLQRLIRAVSNRTGRTRLKSDASERGAYSPRAMVLVTGEALVQVESTLARVMIVEIEKKEEINLEKLTKLQKHSKSLPRAMASYIDWLRPQIMEIQDLFIERFPILRTEFYQDECHGKSPEQMAYLTFALELSFEWMIEKDVITKKQSKKMLLKSRKVFKSSIESHTLLLKTETPTHKYIEILSTLIVQEKVHLRELFGSTEVGTSRLGGQQIGGNFPKETSVHIGYFNDKYFYLFPKGTYKEIVTFSSSTGQHFSTGERTILKMLKEEGILIPRGKNNTYTLNDVEGKNPTVMRLKRDKLVCV